MSPSAPTTKRAETSFWSAAKSNADESLDSIALNFSLDSLVFDFSITPISSGDIILRDSSQFKPQLVVRYAGGLQPNQKDTVSFALRADCEVLGLGGNINGREEVSFVSYGGTSIVNPNNFVLPATPIKTPFFSFVFSRF